MISIIIPCYNQHEVTIECLNSIKDNTTLEHEIIIIDNGSDPRFENINLPINCHIVRNEENLGFPKAVNQGIEISKGEYIILLGNDVIVTPDWEWRLVKYLQRGFSIVSPVTNYCAGMQKTFARVYSNRKELDSIAKDISIASNGIVSEVNWIIGFCMAFSKELVGEIGLLDDSNWPCCGEDIEYCLRAKDKGKKIGIIEEVYVHHIGSVTLSDMDNRGEIDYKELCLRNENIIREKWGKEFCQQRLLQ
jgi:GT2 family glycosyltransferase